MPTWSVQTRGLAVGYDGKPVVRNIDLNIAQGEIVTLIGPNGAGKSTILKSIAHQLEPLSGTVELLGTNLSRFSQGNLAQHLAVMLTERVQPELMTCREVVAMGRYPYTGRLGILSASDWERVDMAMDMLQIGDMALRDFRSISDGQRQRILLARALCQQTEILVLDEPTSYLDIRHKLELLALLRRKAEQGITILMSLHEIELAQKVSDKIVCVEEDAVICTGTPEEVFTPKWMQRLYGVDTYDPAFGSIEMPRVPGEPQIFVISAGGTGIPCYRRLQRAGIPFAAGILYENDVDYTLARHLAEAVVTERPFCEIGDSAFEEACTWIRRVPRVMDAGVPQGACNLRIGDLIKIAQEMGKYERV